MNFDGFKASINVFSVEGVIYGISFHGRIKSVYIIYFQL